MEGVTIEIIVDTLIISNEVVSTNKQEKQSRSSKTTMSKGTREHKQQNKQKDHRNMLEKHPYSFNCNI
jgi:uncharacterized GH25 family protein